MKLIYLSAETNTRRLFALVFLLLPYLGVNLIWSHADIRWIKNKHSKSHFWSNFVWRTNLSKFCNLSHPPTNIWDRCELIYVSGENFGRNKIEFFSGHIPPEGKIRWVKERRRRSTRQESNGVKERTNQVSTLCKIHEYKSKVFYFHVAPFECWWSFRVSEENCLF